LPPILAREGSGVFIDLAPAGFAAAERQPGVLLYPPQEGTMTWSGFDERESAPRDPAVAQGWTLKVEADAGALAIEAGWTGSTPPPANALRILLPRDETRRVALNGAPATVARTEALGVERLSLTWAV